LEHLWQDVRDRSRSFDGLVAFTYATAGFSSHPGGVPAFKLGMLASGNMFRVMGVEPVLGHALWEQQFGSDPSVLGRRVDIDGHPFTVIGVAPAEFTGLDGYLRIDFFVPLMMSAELLTDPKAASLEARDARNLTLKGRLAPGVPLARARTEVATIGAALERAYPETNKNRRWDVRTELQARIKQSPPDARDRDSHGDRRR
jgi:hypothetical protein